MGGGWVRERPPARRLCIPKLYLLVLNSIFTQKQRCCSVQTWMRVPQAQGQWHLASLPLHGTTIVSETRSSPTLLIPTTWRMTNQYLFLSGLVGKALWRRNFWPLHWLLVIISTKWEQYNPCHTYCQEPWTRTKILITLGGEKSKTQSSFLWNLESGVEASSEKVLSLWSHSPGWSNSVNNHASEINEMSGNIILLINLSNSCTKMLITKRGERWIHCAPLSMRERIKPIF